MQSMALNSIVAEMSRRAALNMGEYLDATERYLRLGLSSNLQAAIANDDLMRPPGDPEMRVVISVIGTSARSKL